MASFSSRESPGLVSSGSRFRVLGVNEESLFMVIAPEHTEQRQEEHEQSAWK